MREAPSVHTIPSPEHACSPAQRRKTLRIAVFVVALGALAVGLPAESAPSPTQLPYLQITTQETGVRSLLQAISPVSEDVVWISVHGGTYGLTFASERLGWAVGPDGRVVRIDTGRTQ